MSQKKPSGLWWKTLLAGVVLTILSVTVGLFAAFKEKPKAEVYVRFNTGDEESFEMSKGGTMWLHETNFGLGSSPGSIDDPAKTVRVYGPDGQQIPFVDSLPDEPGWGTYAAPGPGTYKLVADSVGEKVESHGELRGVRPYSVYRTICDVCFIYVLPLGLGLGFLGVVLGIIRGAGKAMKGGLEESSI